MARPTKAQVVKNLRQELGLSQTDAADGFGVSQSMISRIERGEEPQKLEEYTGFIKKRAPRVVGRILGADKGPRRHKIRRNAFRGTVLITDENLSAALAAFGTWMLIGATRINHRTELCFVFDRASRRYGLITARNDRVRGVQFEPADPIVIGAPEESTALDALRTFSEGRFPVYNIN